MLLSTGKPAEEAEMPFIVEEAELLNESTTPQMECKLVGNDEGSTVDPLESYRAPVGTRPRALDVAQTQGVCPLGEQASLEPVRQVEICSVMD